MIDSFLDYVLLEKKYSKHTVTAYKNDLISFRDFLVSEYHQEELLAVHYNQVRSWIVFLVDDKISNRTINRKVSSLKSFYRFLQKTKQLEVNPLAKHRALKVAKKVQVPFSSKEINLVINAIDEEHDFTAVRNKLIVELFYSTGIRRAELIHIKEKDINFSDGVIKVLGKRNKERFVPLLQSVIETQRKYLELKKDISKELELLFITEKGNKIYETLVYRVINSYFSKVSSKVKKSPHILRHSFATHLLSEGADIKSVKELLGHSSLASTQIYANNSISKLKQVYKNSHPRNSN